jgi:Uma2 family endonuclease
MSTSIDEARLAELRRELNLAQAEQRVCVDHVDWDTFDRLLAARGEGSGKRFAFDQGRLEIMSPSEEHEEFTHTLSYLVEIACEETGNEVRNLGALTLRRKDLGRAVEPDCCFYIANEPYVRRKKIDLSADPPPDLVLEIDISSLSLDKFSIYAHIGVPEIWRYDGRRFSIYLLRGGQYVESSVSAAFSWLPASVPAVVLQETDTLGRREATRRFREWIREQTAR